MSRAGSSYQVASGAAGSSQTAASATSPTSTESSSRRSIFFFPHVRGKRRMSSGLSQGVDAVVVSAPVSTHGTFGGQGAYATSLYSPVLDCVAESSDLACEGNRRHRDDSFEFVLAPPVESRAYTLPFVVGVRWSSPTMTHQTLERWRLPSFSRSFNTSLEPMI